MSRVKEVVVGRLNRPSVVILDMLTAWSYHVTMP